MCGSPGAHPSENLGVTLFGEAKRDAPVRTEPHPLPELRLTCAEASRVNPGQPIGIPGLTRGLKTRANDFECRVR